MCQYKQQYLPGKVDINRVISKAQQNSTELLNSLFEFDFVYKFQEESRKSNSYNPNYGSVMGLSLCKLCCCCCCYSCKTKNLSNHSVGVLPGKQLKLLLLGLADSGKTEVGHLLSKKQRTDYEQTNGVQFYQMPLPDDAVQVSITEVGGNAEMQKIWHHYYVATMGIIYCFDMSASYQALQHAFTLLAQTLTQPFVRGKPVLLVATKSDLTHDSVQLYDIEHAFRLQAMAKYYACTIRLCYSAAGLVNARESEADSLTAGINWLLKYLLEHYDVLKRRNKVDANMQRWQQQTANVIAERRRRYQRFPNIRRYSKRAKLWRLAYGRHRAARIRPQTAPPSIFHIDSHERVSLQTITNNAVPNVDVPESSLAPLGTVTSV